VLLGPNGLRLDEWRERGQLTVIKKGRTGSSTAFDLPEGSVYIKHFLVPSFPAKLRQWLRRGKGGTRGNAPVTSDSIGIPTIRPIALGEQRKRKFLFENYLVTPAIADAVALDEFVESVCKAGRDRAGRGAALPGGGPRPLTARLHDSGFACTRTSTPATSCDVRRRRPATCR